MKNSDMPAYPINDENCSIRERAESPMFMQGLSKLEHFSGLAMAAILSNPNLNNGKGYTGLEITHLSILAASELLAELDKESNK